MHKLRRARAQTAATPYSRAAFFLFSETEDTVVCKKAVDCGQLKEKGIGCFCQTGGRTFFKQCTFGAAMAARVPSKGTKLFVVSDPVSASQKRMMKAVEGEGMPRLKSPFEHGNLFVILRIEFPPSLSAETQAALCALLPPPINVVNAKPGDDGVEEVCMYVFVAY